MALSQKLLSQDEVVVRHMHTHIKTLLPAIIVESILVIAAAVGSFYVPENARYWALPTIWIAVLLLSIPLIVVPLDQVVVDHLHGHDQASHHPHWRLHAHRSRPAAHPHLRHSDRKELRRPDLRLRNPRPPDLR